MTLETLQKEMIKAMKERNKERKDTISSLVSAVKKAGIDKMCKDNIPESLVDETILKELKAVNEQVETCPADRTELLEAYKARRTIVEEFAPKLMSKDEVKAYIMENFAEVLASKNKGMIMKSVMPALKGKADGKDINAVVAELM